MAWQISELDTSYAAEAVPRPKRSTNTHDDYFVTYWHQNYSGIKGLQGTDAYNEKFGALEKAAIEYADRQMGIQRQQDAQRVTEWQTKEAARKESHDARKKELQSLEDFFASIDATGDTYRAGHIGHLNHQQLKGAIIAGEIETAIREELADNIDPTTEARNAFAAGKDVVEEPKSPENWIVLGIMLIGLASSFKGRRRPHPDAVERAAKKNNMPSPALKDSPYHPDVQARNRKKWTEHFGKEPEVPGAVSRRKTLITKANSPVWRDLQSFRGKTKTNGLGGKRKRFYEWDHTHNDIEVYDSDGCHLGSMDPVSGEMIKPAVEGRTIDT